jgi:hypothetical protein
VLFDAPQARTRLVGQTVEAVEELAELRDLGAEGVDLGVRSGACGHGDLRFVV